MILKLKLDLSRYIAIQCFQPDISMEERGRSKGITRPDRPDHPIFTLVCRSLPISIIFSPSANVQSHLASNPIQSSSNSSGRQVLKGADLALPVVSTIAGGVPIVGSPIQAAIDGLLITLNVVDVGDILVLTIAVTKSAQPFQQIS